MITGTGSIDNTQVLALGTCKKSLARPNANLALNNVLAMLATIYDANWYPDSKATHQTTPYSYHLLNQVPLNGSKQVLVSYGGSFHIKNIGNYVFKPFSSRHSFKLEKMLNVPYLTKNLLSIS